MIRETQYADQKPGHEGDSHRDEVDRHGDGGESDCGEQVKHGSGEGQLKGPDGVLATAEQNWKEADSARGDADCSSGDRIDRVHSHTEDGQCGGGRDQNRGNNQGHE